MAGIRQFLSRNQGRVAILVVLLVCIYFLVIFGEQAWQANRLEGELDQQRQGIANIRRENAELATRAEQMNSSAYYAYVEQVARRDLGLSRPGETVIIVPRPASAALPTATPVPSSTVSEKNWELWIDAIFNPEES